MLAHLPCKASGLIGSMGYDLGWRRFLAMGHIGLPDPALVDVLTDGKDLTRTYYFKRGTPVEKKKNWEEEEGSGGKEQKEGACGRNVGGGVMSFC